MTTMSLHIWLIFALAALCRGHLRLTYPPARFPDLDFLDNARTQGPCGVSRRPPGPGTHTNLLAGSTITITWFMAYPHQGGYKIELLDANDNFVEILTKSPGTKGFKGLTDHTKEREVVTLPRRPCQNCVIRMIREANEWGMSYNFWSCSDVNIVTQLSPQERCSRKGAFSAQRCYCEPLRSGEFCEYGDECHASAHCGPGKACKWLSERSYPKWGCFEKLGARLPPGRFIPTSLFDPRNFKVRDVGQGNKIYWQIVPQRGEIKFVLQFKTKSWVAVGWKPLNLNADRCTNIVPGISWKRGSSASAEPEPNSEPEGGTVPKHSAAPEPRGEPEPGTPLAEPNFRRPVPEPIRDLPTQPEQRFSSDFDLRDHSCEGSWEWPRGCIGPQCDYRLKWAYGGDQEEIAFFLDTRVPRNNWWTGVGFSKSGRMSDADMVTIKIEGGLLSLYDMHSVGYAAPRMDPKQNVFTRVAPTVAYSDGRLKAMFGRKLNTRDFIHDVIFNRTSSCYYFLFPVKGGPVDPRTGRILKHVQTPHISERVTCIQSCKRGRNQVVPVSVPEPEPIARTKRQTNRFLPAVPNRLHFLNPIGARRHTSHSLQHGTGQQFAVPEPVPRPEPHAPPHAEPHAGPHPEPHSKPHAEPQAEPHAEPHAEPQGEPEPGAEAEPASGGQLHPMDCTDIVIGAVEDDAFRIFDYYTVSRATPRRDEFYNGKQSLTAAVGFQRDGVTTVMFRKKLRSSDSADHSFTPGPMTLIWAYGQELGAYSHRPKSGLESGYASVSDFYEPNTPRYHGKTNRGYLTVDFYGN